MSNLPSTQRAWQIVSKGHPSKTLRLVSDLPVPTKVPPGNVLIKVHAGALNPVEHKVMRMLPNSVAGRPTTPAYELSGTVIDGNGTEWQNGDEVVANFPISLTFKTKQGALMEYTYAPANVIVKRPEQVSPIGAAGVALVAQTAWQALYDVAGLEEGKSVFINGGSTAVGSYAIQFAKAKGCRVTATASGKNEQYVRDLGADEFIDYTKVNLSKHLSESPPATKYHVFFETVGLLDSSLFLRSEKYIAPGGYFVHVGPLPKGLGDVPKVLRLGFEGSRPPWLGGVKRNFRILSVKPKQDDMNAIFALIAEGKVRTLVDSVFEFEDAVKAYERLMTGRATGKVIVKVEPDID